MTMFSYFFSFLILIFVFLFVFCLLKSMYEKDVDSQSGSVGNLLLTTCIYSHAPWD